MQVTINVPDELAEAARARGVSTEVYVEKLLAEQASSSAPSANLQSARDAVEQIRQLRKGTKLDGLRIKDLIEEDRKY